MVRWGLRENRPYLRSVAGVGLRAFAAVAVLASLEDPGVGHVGHFGDDRQVVATEAVGRFPLLATLVLLLEDPTIAYADLRVVHADCGPSRGTRSLAANFVGADRQPA